MTAQIEWLGEVPDLGKVGRVVAPWNEQVEAFAQAGAEIVDTQDVAATRLANIYDGFTRTNIMPVSVKGKPTILVRPSDFTTPHGALEIVAAHRKGAYPKRSTDFYDAAEEIAKTEETLEPEERTHITMSQIGDHSLSKEMPQARFLLGLRTNEYFKAKEHEQIPFYDLEGTSTKYADVNYLWFYVPQDGSGLSCRYLSLDFHNGALGVLRKTAESGSRSPGYVSLTDVRNANSQAVARVLEEEGLSGLNKRLTQRIGEATLEQVRLYNK
jgi:hypothetical protein